MDDLMFGGGVMDRREMPVRFAWAPLDFGDRVEAATLLKMIADEVNKGRQSRIALRVSDYKIAVAVAATLTYRNWYAFPWYEDEDESHPDFEKPTVVVHPSLNPERL